MQIIQEISFKEAKVIVAKLESFEEDYLASYGFVRDESKKKIERQAQSFMVRVLLSKELDVPHESIKNNDKGKPFIEGVDVEVSLSHTGLYLAIMIANKPCGLDIEQLQGKVLRIAHKFVREEERALYCVEDEMFGCHLIWGAKESLFKLYSDKQVDYLKHLKIEGGESLKGQILKDDQVTICSGEALQIEDMLLVYFLKD